MDSASGCEEERLNAAELVARLQLSHRPSEVICGR